MICIHRWKGPGLLVAAGFALSLVGCEYLLPKSNAQICEDYCQHRMDCQVEDTSQATVCNQDCVSALEAGNEPTEFACDERSTCDALQACIACIPYCDKFVSCEFGSEASCVSSCERERQAGREALGETCVVEEACDEGSLCILCDQYCRKLKSCNVSTDSSCASSCVTLLQSGADEAPYQCVVDSVCSEVPNCGI
ncbi:MAG: hypothetical protein ABIJ09_07030 [Pseudomonadota bacterium]